MKTKISINIKLDFEIDISLIKLQIKRLVKSAISLITNLIN